MIVFIDSEYKCHVSDDGTMKSYDVSFFDGKCSEFIEGYHFIPIDKTWIREDGIEFQGEMIAPWKPYTELEIAQLKYENDKLMAEKANLEFSYQKGVNSI